MSKTYYSGTDTGVGFAVPVDPKSVTDGLQDEQIKSRVKRESDNYQEALKGFQVAQSVIARKTEGAKRLSDTLRNNADTVWKKSQTGEVDTAMIRAFGEAIANTLSLYDLEPEDMGNEVKSLYELTQSELRSGDMELIASKADDAMQAIESVEDRAKKSSEYEHALSAMLTAQRNYQLAVGDAMRAKVKSGSRLLESVGAEVDLRSVTSVPPNYQLSDGDSPRQCSTCKFFKNVVGGSGHCELYNREVKAKYICDVWQGQDLTTFHTPVRKISPKSYTETEGEVWATSQDVDPDSKVWVTNVVNYNEEDERHTEPFPDNDLSRAVLKDFLPSDVVYLRSMRSLGRIESLVDVDGTTIYSVKLMDGNGNVTGMAYTYSEDLTARSSKAIKGGFKSVSLKSLDDDLHQMVQIVRSFYKSLDAICTEHSDVREKPLDNTNVLTPLRDAMLTELESPLFDNVATGKRRKYFRALQSAMTAVGAARLVLFEAFKVVNMLSNSSGEKSLDDQRHVMLKAQQDAYDRLEWARKMLYDSLVLPSATHGDEAPKIKSVDMAKQMLDSNNIFYDEISSNESDVAIIGRGMASQAGADAKLAEAIETITQNGYTVWESWTGSDSSQFPSIGYSYMVRFSAMPEPKEPEVLDESASEEPSEKRFRAKSVTENAEYEETTELKEGLREIFAGEPVIIGEEAIKSGVGYTVTVRALKSDNVPLWTMASRLHGTKLVSSGLRRYGNETYNAIVITSE